MRHVLLILAALLLAAPTFAQPTADALRRKEAGNTFLKERRYQEARDQYLAALQLAPDYPEAHYNLGVIYFFRLHDHPRALYHFTRYVELVPDAEDLAQVRSLTLQALEKIEAEERVAYRQALEAGTVYALQSFLAEHPGSWYAADAREKLRGMGK